MPRKTEYCLAVDIGGQRHRAWLPRKADACAFARAIVRMAPSSPLVEGIKAVAVVDVNRPRDEVAFEWPKGVANELF